MKPKRKFVARSHLVFSLFVLLTLSVPLAWQRTGAGQTSSAEYEVSALKDVMVSMREGVRLATDIYLPARGGAVVPGKFPVLLARTPYGKNGMEADGQFFARRGYATVIQDVRGRYESEGTFYIYASEGKDGYDALEWAARQPWSNGSVGTFGPSYLAATQNALALERPPHLKAMFVIVGTSNYHEDGQARAGATYLLHNVAYAFNLASTSKEAQADPARGAALAQGAQPRQLAEWLRAYPYRNPSPFALFPAYDRWFKDWVDHPDYDDYWKQKFYTFELYYEQFPDVPVYYVGGWYDIFLRGTLNNYVGLSKVSKTPKKLLVGPWVHGVGPNFSGDVAFGPSAAVDIRSEQLRWFDQVLRGADTGVVREPPVKLFMMGGGDGSRTREGRLFHGGEWRTYSTWPTPGANAHSFYLHADGTLSEQMPGESTPSVFTFDPSNPVPTIGGGIDSGKELVGDGPRDQRCSPTIFGCHDSLPLSARHDVLVFQTPPLERDVEVSGPITVNLWVASSAPDTDFTAKLIDVYPPNTDYPWGYDMLLADRIVRVRYSKSPEKPELLKPGEIRKVTIDLLGTSNRFTKGHRIRLDVSSSNFPFFDVNPNTGEPVGKSTRIKVAEHTVFHDKSHPSHIILPLLPAGLRVTER